MEFKGGFVDGVTLYRFRSTQGNDELVTVPDTIEKIGNSAFEAQTLKRVFIPSSVKTVGDFAFNECRNLREVTLSEGVCELGEWAFSGCKRLNAVHFPSTLTKVSRSKQPLNGCANVKSITVEAGNPVYHSAGDCLIETKAKVLISGCQTSVIPSDGSVKAIGKGAFVRIGCLTTVTIPETVEKIGELAFFLSGLRGKIVIPDSVKSIGVSAFEDCGIAEVKLGRGLEKIGRAAFQLCSNLGGIELPDGVVTVGASAFAHSGLKYFKACSGLTALGEAVFRHCHELTEVELNEGLTSLPKDAFFCCEKLERIRIPASVTSIGARAFASCRNLKEVIIGNENAVFASDAFLNCPYQPEKANIAPKEDKSKSAEEVGEFEIKGKTLKKYTGSGERAVVPDGITKIASRAFASNDKIKEVVLPEGLATIDKIAFKNCKNLVRATFPKGLQAIGYEAFAGCVALEEICLPEGFEDVDTKAFAGCKGVKRIKLPKSLSRIGCDGLQSCAALESITVEEGNPEFAVWGNCLIELGTRYGKPDNKVVLGCKNSVIPSGRDITAISHAFCGCSSLEELVIPEGVEFVFGGDAFEGCTGLKRLTLPESFRSPECFCDSVNLESVTAPERFREFFANLNPKTEFHKL